MMIGIGLALTCLVAGGLGTAYLVRNVPGVARVFRGNRATPVPASTTTTGGELLLSTVTLTPAPSDTPAPPTVSPTASPSPTATAADPDQGTSATATGAPSTLTASPTPSPSEPPSTDTPLPPTATPTPRPQWLAFESKRGEFGDYEIMVMKPDGSRVTNLTQNWADDVAPVWSPDGRHIAFVSLRDTAAGKWGLGDGSIYVIEFDPETGTGGRVWRVTGKGSSEGWPTWSPDGQRIAFQSNRSGNWDIWIANADGSGLVQLTHHAADDRYAAWSPDGTQMAFTSNRNGNEEVWVLPIEEALAQGDDSGAVNLSNSPQRDRYPMWSPNGKRLTFNTNRDGDYEVYIMNADGSQPRNISQSPDSTEGLADWSPDGRRLVLYSTLSGNKEIYVLDLASGRWTNVSNDKASDEFCTWSP
jgi:Tol biopolymer transport system component